MAKPRNTTSKNEQGMIVVAMVGIMVFLSIIMIGIFSLASSNLNRARGRIFLLQAQYSAESGADAAIATLNSGNATYTGTTSDIAVLTATNYLATYSVSVANGSSSKERILTATGKVYTPKNASTPKYVRKIRVTVQQNSTSTAASVLSRNILAFDSGVKNLFATDLYVNGFINMSKNTTNLIAENITVAGKNTGATNCSIGGSGNLVKPTTFTHAGQTKTNIITAYNNCVSPPGNSSNTDFNVSANQGNVSTVQSTYLPWSSFMDATYTNAGSCNDWTSGTSPRSIPTGAGTKKTHYPDNGNNVSASCGTSGDISLGSSQYNLNDNVHLRANLCVATACNPTFNNPSSSMVYLFVEGDVNFSAVQTAPGSGPIALVVYGSDPASKTSVCPYGGAAFIGNSSNTNAPALYIMAMNGICLDKTKFGSSPALGGVGGKNIYIATNPGTPFDLKLDPAFPVGQIPIDLSWRAIRYQRL